MPGQGLRGRGANAVISARHDRSMPSCHHDSLPRGFDLALKADSGGPSRDCRTHGRTGSPVGEPVAGRSLPAARRSNACAATTAPGGTAPARRARAASGRLQRIPPRPQARPAHQSASGTPAPPCDRRPLPAPASGFEEGGQEVAAGGQHPGELGKVRRQLPWRRMDDGIPGHDAAQCAISQLQGLHRPDLKAQARMLAAGKVDHGRRRSRPKASSPSSRR